MSSPERRWPWWSQIVDAVTAALGIAIAVTMLIRDSWPVMGVMFALICMGKVGASAFVKMMADRWGP